MNQHDAAKTIAELAETYGWEYTDADVELLHQALARHTHDAAVESARLLFRAAGFGRRPFPPSDLAKALDARSQPTDDPTVTGFFSPPTDQETQAAAAGLAAARANLNNGDT